MLEPVGTAPGAVVPFADGSGPTVVVLPGPPRELHEMWAEAVQAPEFQEAVRDRGRYDQHMLRLFGIPESEIAETLRVAEARSGAVDFERLEITTCLRRAEVEVVVRHEPDAAPAWNELLDLVSVRHARHAVLDRRLVDRRPGGRAAGGALGRRWRSRAPAG